MKTFSAKPGDVKHDWYVVDAQGKVLGRLAAQIAARLRGKHKPEYTPHVDTGDFIVVVNVGGLRVTGRKTLGKKYYRHSGYPGGVSETNFAKLQARFPSGCCNTRSGACCRRAAGYAMLKKLKVYSSGESPPQRTAAPDTGI